MSPFAKSSTEPLYPLDEFYAASRLPMPRIMRLEGDAMPQPYRDLLVHDDDMTPTLERYHSDGLHLRVISRREEAGSLFREVVLVRDADEQPVEFGAIRIEVEKFPELTREVIRACRQPLGSIMAEYGVEHSGHPSAYFQVVPDDVIRQALGQPASGDLVLYGRHNVHVSPDGQPLAHVVEILPRMGEA